MGTFNTDGTWTSENPGSVPQPVTKLQCDMRHDCDRPVTMIDNEGFAYCSGHGLDRQRYHPCRKLRPYELNRLQRGQQLLHY